MKMENEDLIRLYQLMTDNAIFSWELKSYWRMTTPSILAKSTLVCKDETKVNV